MTKKTSRELPPEIRHFVQAAIVVGDLALPSRYVPPDEIDALQVGFRSHGHTGESLISTDAGAWQPGWFVVAMNYFDDPFFIDIADEATGFPVYFAQHGGGRWNAIPVAVSLRRFSEILGSLKAMGDDDAQVSKFVEDESDVSNPFWSEVVQARRERADEDQQIAPVACDPANLETVELVVTDFGAQKLKVVQVLRRVLGLSLQEAIALTAESEVVIGKGPRISLQRQAAELVAVGAGTEFRLRAE